MKVWYRREWLDKSLHHLRLGSMGQLRCQDRSSKPGCNNWDSKEIRLAKNLKTAKVGIVIKVDKAKAIFFLEKNWMGGRAALFCYSTSF